MSTSDTEVLDRIEQMSKLEPNVSFVLRRFGSIVFETDARPGQWFAAVLQPKGAVWIHVIADSAVEAVRDLWVKFQHEKRSWGNRQRW
jgi:hypothetical protein